MGKSNQKVHSKHRGAATAKKRQGYSNNGHKRQAHPKVFQGLYYNDSSTATADELSNHSLTAYSYDYKSCRENHQSDHHQRSPEKSEFFAYSCKDKVRMRSGKVLVHSGTKKPNSEKSASCYGLSAHKRLKSNT